jgi:hypothetical protein
MDYKNPLKMIDPLTGMEMTPQPPMPANQMGTAKPVFNQTAQNVGNQVYGTPFQRQMSMPQPPMFMKDIPEGNKGKGLRALDDSVVEQMGYDSATKMMSPLDSHHPGDKKMLKTLTKKRKETTGLRKFANILTGGLGELAAEAVHNLKNYNNVSKQTFTKEKTNMPKKRVPRVNPGYVTDINTGERIGVEEIPFKDFKQR